MRYQVQDYIKSHPGTERLLEIYDFMIQIARWNYHIDSDISIDLFVLLMSNKGIRFVTNEIDSYIYGGFEHYIPHQIPDQIYDAMNSVGWPEYSIRVKNYSTKYSNEDFIFNLPTSVTDYIDTITPINVEQYINSMNISCEEYIAKFKEITKEIDNDIATYILKLVSNEDNLVKLAVLHKYDIRL